MAASNLLAYEQVHVLNLANGSRLITYVIPAPKNSGEICINGAAAHLVSKGDLVIIVAYGDFNIDSAQNHSPKIVHVNQQNQITK
jgi:aspartate 1-decarboxylase